MRAEKQSMADELRTKVNAAGFVILADFKGLKIG